MIDQELMRELTESYLKSCLCGVSNSLEENFDSFATFAELGVDSFSVLKVIRKLESDFGTLPKTLLFDHFRISDLAQYFLGAHRETLARKFAPQLRDFSRSGASLPAAPAEPPDRLLVKAGERGPPGDGAEKSALPILILEKDAEADAELGPIVRELFERYKGEGAVSRGTRIIAPNLFIGGERRGYINFNRRKDLLLTYAYVGPADYFPIIAREIHQYCVSRDWRLNILSDHCIESVGDTAFTSTPFGLLQRIANIQEFTLEGGAMRRLRYQVKKFESAGVCRTAEYRCGSSRETDRSIAHIIDEWCAARTMVNPLIHIVRDEILSGRLGPQHRLFLTYLDEVLQNVVLISAMSAAHNGWLMDLEFYGKEMPLGGLEFAIVQIIAVLAAEGGSTLSLGGTYGVRLGTSPNADAGIVKVLDDLQRQNIFNDEGNLQFKNKFRPENRTIFLSRPVDGGSPDDVIDVIMMIADPAIEASQTQAPGRSDPRRPALERSAQRPASGGTRGSTDGPTKGPMEGPTEEPTKRPPGRESTGAPAAGVTPGQRATVPEQRRQPAPCEQQRTQTLQKCGFNPLNIPDDQVDWDLKTDSWAQLRLPAIDAQMQRLHAQLQQPADVDAALRAIFPFAHFQLANSGRSAEQVFYQAWPKRGVVPQNLLFPTGIFHQIDKGYTPQELVPPETFRLDSRELFKGNLAFEALRERVTGSRGAIAFVCIELSNNGAGGYPVAMRHLKEVKALLEKHSIALVIDATRVLENAQFNIEAESEYAQRNIWGVAREILSLADVVIGSLAKDFCVNRGGIIATNDAALARRIQDCMEEEGLGLDVVDRKLIALALQDRRYIEVQVLRRMEAVKHIWSALKTGGVPVVAPAACHCVLIDVKQIEACRGFAHPVASFLAWLYSQTGIRAGAHSVGMQKKTAINDLVRLAIPLGLTREQGEAIADRLVACFRTGSNIPQLVLESGAPESFGDVHVNYRLERPDAAAPHPTGPAPPAQRDDSPQIAPMIISRPDAKEPAARPAAAQTATEGPRQRGPIAVVGMSGRFPKARNAAELWENLVQGRDCIEEMSAQRRATRLQYGSMQNYRGGFIDDVDKFDSLFFNISPREAQMLDPQERLFLEVAWEAIEDAGYYPEILAEEDAPRNVGVFVGAVWAMYQMLGVEERHLGNKAIPNSFLWSIANRVSYWMNLSGPSLTVDTACSSSLTALYLACEAIRSGRCSAALVGGVNLDLHQSKWDINVGGGALSKDGVCRSFGEGANGYVAGEGIGALFLKPLDRALGDGDHIYGVIKAVVVNHGGHTSGYTVPSTKAQTNLILAALGEAAVDARSIGYVEAHGTGTELGDPIEIAGLTNAFQTHGAAKQGCGIGSIKSNIGHLEAAAGVVSVCKVLLQMQHRRLVPSLHSSEPNQFIDFANSPFYVTQKVEEWRPKNVDGVQYPLRAGISSFGAGGSNAHVILESHDPRPAPPPALAPQPNEQLFVLSARHEEQLREVAIRLRNAVEKGAHRQDAAADGLKNMAYTLQAGRKSFDHRAAIAAKTDAELIDKLNRLIDGRGGDDIAIGHVGNAESITRLLTRREREEFIALLSQRRDPLKLAQLWVDGVLPDWHALNPSRWGNRVPLPTYPFADRRHWVCSPARAAGIAAGSQSALHPLIDSNESTFERQIFKKTFTERDFLIHDHVVADIPTLPGMAYLELARKAGEIAAGRKVQRIKNILWVSPITVRQSQPKAVSIELKPNAESVQFEVFSEEQPGVKVLHSQGKLFFANEREAAAEPEYIDLGGIAARTRKVIEGKDAYPLFKSFGLELGPSFQVLKQVVKNETETLGELQLAEFRRADLESMVLHPALVDGSLQAGMAAQLREKTDEMLVPFTIGEVEILHPVTPHCFSYVTAVTEDGNKTSRVSRTNILIVDEEGKILVRIRESVGVPLREINKKAVPADDAEKFTRLYYSHEWVKAPPAAHTPGEDRPPAILLFDVDESLCGLYAERLEKAGIGGSPVILVQPGDGYRESAGRSYTINPLRPKEFTRLLDSLNREKISVDAVCFAWPTRLAAEREHEEPGTALRESLQIGVYAFLFLCQALIKYKWDGKVRLLYLHLQARGGFLPEHEAINGFIRALHLEHPRLPCKAVAIGGRDISGARKLEAVLAELRADTQDAQTVRYDDEGRFVRQLKSMQLDAVEAPAGREHGNLKVGGVYLISGGAGGLGLIFTEYLARELKAKLVLIGRSELSAERAARLDEIRRSGAEIVYLPADVANHGAVRDAVAECKRRFGCINGVIHAAGVLKDSYLRKKTPQEMQAVLEPKVFGTVHLDEATRGEPLDFFVMFSSLAAVTGNAGQVDYAYANHFMDSFARRREELCSRGARSGRTLSLNWSLWADGGMKLDEPTELFFRKTLGIKPLSTVAGIEAFRGALASGRSQLAVLEGAQEKVEVAWGLRKRELQRANGRSEPLETPAPSDAAPVPASGEPGAVPTRTGDVAKRLAPLVEAELSEIAMHLLKLEAEDVAADKILLDLGFDSIGLTTYANAINDKYGLDITPVAFFDFPSIREISKHLVAERPSEVAAFHRRAPAPAAPVTPAVRVLVPPQGDVVPMDARWATAKGQSFRELDRAARAPAPRDKPAAASRFADMPIAIVGISGVMPQSEDLDEFWDNLREGRNLVTEIPADRWKWQDFHGDPLKDANKSNSKWGGFMREVDKFDPLFFGISPREAQMMDPQQRIFLQIVWKAVEDSGHKLADLAGTKTGVFVGVATNDYIDVMNSAKVGLDGYSASGNSHSVLANRISFLLNLRGPSAPIDTACSSSLVAIHRAIESMHTGSCDMAIVGGVQVMLTPAAYISFSMAGMLSADGKCKTFDKAANGYVRGEGSGAIFLKPLSLAEADGNHIYAVIRATAENHGGRVTTLTAPNAGAQAELLIEAYQKAEIDPATVGYIECHGTGTSLGDPIEVQALKKAFAELYKRHDRAPALVPHCGLSAVKTNIGHLETAAGIAGMLKALLAIKHRQIPASIHFEEANPYIDLKDSPFFIVRKTTEWEAPRGADGAALPRRVGVSSFGFGGANAHIVLEEYVGPPSRCFAEPAGPQLIVLSAKNEDRLEAYVRSMRAHLDAQPVALRDFAYTLQVGRDPMPERLAFVAADIAELKAKFGEFLSNDGKIAGACRNKVGNRSKPGTGAPGSGGADLDVPGLVESGQLGRLAELWVCGEPIDWLSLHRAGVPRRISLPTYPFAKERYWIPAVEERALEARHDRTAGALHPLVHRNASTLRELKFVAQFSGEEFFFADHVVQRQKILPGVAYMEMARVAGGLSSEKEVRSLKNVVWERPLVVTGSVKAVEICITATATGAKFAVRTPAASGAVTHCTGELSYASDVAEPDVLDIAGILDRCPEEVIAGAELYPFLAQGGLMLGKSFQIVERIYASRSESLAVLKLPEHLKGAASQFVLHPALMDGSLHTAIGLMKANGMDIPLSVPYSVGEVQIIRSLEDLHYGYATWDGLRGTDQSGAPQASFQLLDRNGRVLARIKGLVSRAFLPNAKQAVAPAAHGAAAPAHTQIRWYRDVWREERRGIQNGNLPAAGCLLLFDRTDQIHDALQRRLQSSGPANPTIISVRTGAVFREVRSDLYEINPDDERHYPELLSSLERRGLLPETIVHLWSGMEFDGREEGLRLGMRNGVFSLFNLIRALTRIRKPGVWAPSSRDDEAGRRAATQLLYCYSNHPGGMQPQHAASGAFLKSIGVEDSRFIGRTVEIQLQGAAETISVKEMVDYVAAELREGPSAAAVRYSRGIRFVKGVEECELPGASANLLKQGGVYLITGGAGGLGFVFAKYLAMHARARIALVGRSALCRQGRIEELEALGARVAYYRADVADFAAVKQLIEDVGARFGRLNGIFHAAGVLKDAAIRNKTMADMRSVFDPKILGTLNLDLATQSTDLDFFALFSSLTAVTGLAGQCDYAYANSFMDHFAERRSRLVAEGRRSGKTLSLNWPLWKEGGMQTDARISQFLQDSMGITPLDTQVGLDTFTRSLANGEQRILVMQGMQQKIRKMLGVPGEDAPKAAATRKSGAGGEQAAEQAGIDLRQRLSADLLRTVTKVLMIAPERFSADTDMSEYGLDSVSLISLFGDLNNRYALDLTPAVFFEYPTLNALVHYMVTEYQDVLQTHFCHAAPGAAAAGEDTRASAGPPGVADENSSDASRHAAQVIESPAANGAPAANRPVAVVGIAGVFPNSDDVEEFWSNIEAEKDLISEIPPDRWDWSAYAGDPFAEKNKTNSRWGGFMKEVDKFDTAFFGITPLEAELMDPQKRIFLETVWKAIEDAGHKPSELAGTKTGVFVGVAGFDHLQLLIDNKVDVVAHTATGVSHCVLPNRISYMLDLRGPSEPIDTACSSSLVAVHRAVEAIHNGNCEMAIAGGVNVLLTPSLYVSFANAGMLSNDGRCKTFDSRADGYVRGEGSGAVFLKPLDRAIADGDHIYGVIKGSGVNHGGRASSLTAPNPNAQADLLIDVYEKAQIDPECITYIEAHGTGTPLGDPVELNGLKKAFKELYKRRNQTQRSTAFCGVGSVKTNIGHLETAAGIAGLIKVLLSFKHRKLPGNVHYREPNPHIRLDGSPFYIVEKTRDWAATQDEERREIPRTAGVSSFGFGGANAHVVLQEYRIPQEVDAAATPIDESGPVIVPLSAKTAEQLRHRARDLLSFLARQSRSAGSGSIELAALAYTLQVGREDMVHRVAFVVNSLDELTDKLRAYLGGDLPIDDCYRGTASPKSAAVPDDSAGGAGVDDWLAGRGAARLLTRWVTGRDVDWHRLYPARKPRRVSLPTYPFARERHWIETAALKTAAAHDDSAGRVRRGEFDFLLDRMGAPIPRAQTRRRPADSGDAFEALLDSIQ